MLGVSGPERKDIYKEGIYKLLLTTDEKKVC